MTIRGHLVPEHFGVATIVRTFSDSAVGRALWVLGSLLVAALLVLPVAFAADRWLGVYSAAAAWGTCLVSGLLALWLVQLFNGPDKVVPQVLVGMFPRMGIPLGVCMAVYLRGGTLAEAGFVFYILAFYFVTLAVETILLVGTHNRKTHGLEHGHSK